MTFLSTAKFVNVKMYGGNRQIYVHNKLQSGSVLYTFTINSDSDFVEASRSTKSNIVFFWVIRFVSVYK